jgi:hypothetical protein
MAPWSAAAAGIEQQMDGLFTCPDGGPLYTEVFPTSPVLLEPFTQPFAIPAPMRPSDPAGWNPITGKERNWRRPDCRAGGIQDDDGVVHQIGPRRSLAPTTR